MKHQYGQEDQQERFTVERKIQQRLGRATEDVQMGIAQHKVGRPTDHDAHNGKQDSFGQFQTTGKRLHRTDHDKQYGNCIRIAARPAISIQNPRFTAR